ncbi:MAG: hypothetical protein ABW352_23990 [Polyangiales bacterium]
MQGNGFFAIVLLLLPLGCTHGSVFTNYGATVPVMVGPVRTLRTSQPHGLVVHAFATEVIDLRAASSSTTQQGNYVTTTTTSSVQHEGPGKFDLAVHTALQQFPRCSVRTERLKVGAYFFFGGAAIIDKSWASAESAVHEAVRR